MAEAKEYDIVIIGGGISGTALLYSLTKYTNIKSVALLEKHKDYAQVSSHGTQNSQTLHFGDIETNYTYAKAAKVSQGARLVQNYLEYVAKKEGVFIKPHKMVLGVGEAEVKELKQRYKEFKKLFPKNKLLERKEIKKIEPKIVEGRDKDEPIIAYYSPDGYTVDYYKLAKSFVKHTPKNKGKKVDINLKTEVKHIEDEGDSFYIETNKGDFKAKVVISDAGSMSLRLAKKMGYGKHLSVLSVAGNFYRGPQALKGKVYTVQNKKLPFAAVHGDPDVHAKGYTRYGPSAKVLFMLERYNNKSIWDYFASFNYSINGFLSLLKLASDWTSTSYIMKNYLYEIPYFGTRIFSKNVKKIIPTTEPDDIKKDKGYGATRPQIINTKTKTLALGEARIKGERIIFNITPSPGASTCLQNARVDIKDAMQFLGKEYKFDENRFERDLLKI